jgi:phosphohistidine phosphatase
MKTLLLLRHAKSSWDDPSQRDFDRPLNGRGLKAAPLIGKFIRRQKIEPDLALSSPAKRAKQTTTLVLESAKITVELRYDERIYEASVARLLEVISRIEEQANLVLIVGHNPGMEELLLGLTGEARRMPTAALARIALNIEKWNEVRERSGRLEWLVTPKELSND